MAKYCNAKNKTHLKITLFIFLTKVFSANLFILRDVFKFTKIYIINFTKYCQYIHQCLTNIKEKKKNSGYHVNLFYMAFLKRVSLIMYAHKRLKVL